MFMAKRWAMGVVAILAFCFVSGGLALHAYTRDLDRSADADLSLLSARVPPEHNALTSLLAAMKALHYPADYIDSADRIDLAIIGADWDSKWVGALLRSNAEALTRYEQARGTDSFQVRVHSVRGERQALDNWLMLAKLRALEIRVQGLTGDGDGALRSALDLAHFGARIRELDGGRMIHYLTGVSVIRVALEAFQRILTNVPLDSARAEEMFRSLETLRLGREGWSQVARGDYQWSKAVLDESVAARHAEHEIDSRDPFAREVLDSMLSIVPIGYSLQRNRTLQRLGDHYRHSMRHLPATCREWGVRKHGADMLRRAPSVYSIQRNALGDYWADLAHTSIQLYRRTSCVSESNISAVQVMVALRAFEADRGHMPETLDELAPDYFARVPLDYFDGHPIRYAQSRHLIYSVGSDLADAQGQRAPGEPCNAELSFPIPFATRNHGAPSPARIICAVSRS